MSAQPKYDMQPDFDKALTAFSGYVDHTVNLTKADIRREIIESEDRLRTEIQTQIQASEARLRADIQTQIQASEARLRTEIHTQIQASEARLQAQIQASEARLQAQIDGMKQQIDRVENIGKSNHQMFQIMLDQFSKISNQLNVINKKLGID